MPKPTRRLFMMAIDLVSAMKAVNKADSSFLSGMKIAENVKMPTVMKNPVVIKHPKTENIKILSVELPRELINFDKPFSESSGSTSVMENFELLNRNKRVSLFPNVDRRQLSAEGLMSAELFKELAKAGKVKIHKQPPIKMKAQTELPGAASFMPSSVREYTQGAVDDAHITRHARDLSSFMDEINITAEDKLTPVQKTIKKAWEPHADYLKYSEEVVKEDTKYGDKVPKITSIVAQSIRETSEKMLPISEPRKKGINRNLIYRRMFKEPKDE